MNRKEIKKSKSAVVAWKEVKMIVINFEFFRSFFEDSLSFKQIKIHVASAVVSSSFHSFWHGSQRTTHCTTNSRAKFKVSWTVSSRTDWRAHTYLLDWMGSNEMRKVKQKTMREDEDGAAAAAEEDEKLFINRFSRRKKNKSSPRKSSSACKYKREWVCAAECVREGQ